jgi:hypothetical protein
MTWVERIGPATPAIPGAGRQAARGVGFSVPSRPPEAAAGASAPADVVLGGMLALQEAESGTVRDREARRRGEEILAALSRLQRALLDGRRDIAALTQLADLAREVPAAADPALRQAVADVVLRARVELSRHASVMTG